MTSRAKSTATLSREVAATVFEKRKQSFYNSTWNVKQMCHRY